MKSTTRWPIECLCSTLRPRPCSRHSATPPPTLWQRWVWKPLYWSERFVKAAVAENLNTEILSPVKAQFRADFTGLYVSFLFTDHSYYNKLIKGLNSFVQWIQRQLHTAGLILFYIYIFFCYNQYCCMSYVNRTRLFHWRTRQTVSAPWPVSVKSCWRHRECTYISFQNVFSFFSCPLIWNTSE